METPNLKNKIDSSFQATLKNRLVRYADLKPCKNAFVDTRTPGSDQKENFTIIGPGVSENPNQHVHIPIPHSFNIGAARQPGGCLNSQHSHETAEVFIVHSGKWRFMWGKDANDGEIFLNEGDIVSIPTHMFRGFENIGSKEDVSFLFAILGGDDPGFVTWAPSVFQLAKKYGLILLENGRLVDTAVGEKVPDNIKQQTPPSEEMLAKLKSPSNEEMEKCFVFAKDIKDNSNSPLAKEGVSEAPIIGKKPSRDGFDFAPIIPWWPQGFHLRRMTIRSGFETSWFSRDYEEVLLMQKGTLEISIQSSANSKQDRLYLGAGDTISIPKNDKRRYRACSSATTEFFVVLKGDSPGPLMI